MIGTPKRKQDRPRPAPPITEYQHQQIRKALAAGPEFAGTTKQAPEYTAGDILLGRLIEHEDIAGA